MTLEEALKKIDDFCTQEGIEFHVSTCECCTDVYIAHNGEVLKENPRHHESADFTFGADKTL